MTTRQYELVERVKSYEPDADEALLNRAYVYAMKAHGNQKRASGAPFFSHPLEVAAILAEMRLDDATIATALLHDTIEDTGATRSEIDALFGAEIGSLVDGLTKIKKLDLVTKKAEQAENFRKLLLAISSDIRVLLVKFADRLHNMRTLGAMKPTKRTIIAEETMDIYAPLAGRMGMQWLRDELEDHAFRWLNPEGYAAVVDRLKMLRDRNQGLIEEIENALRKKLEEARVPATVAFREKKPYAIWSKMERKQISLEQLSDIYAFRIVVNEVEVCYRALAVVHTTWHAVPGRFKDYISSPKQNDYQSIHTTIVGPRHQRAELQIRTERMHSVAEYGVAAHALYKDSANSSGPQNSVLPSHESNAYRWLRHLVDMLLEGDNPEEFLEHTKLELFQDQVFCFTPKGRLIALPRGANPIDFAYAVHTDIGNTCVGCKINGRAMPLVTELRNGDEVEIIISEVQAPPSAWQSLAVTGKARSAIRRATRDAARAQYGKLGREILQRAFNRRGKAFSEEAISQALTRLSQKTTEDIIAAVGRGELSSADVIRAAWPEDTGEAPKRRRKVKRAEEGWFGLGKVMGLKFRWPGSSNSERSRSSGASLPIRGLRGDLPVSFAEDGAVPGDRIVGILTPGQGITIYPIHAEALKAFDEEPERWIDVTWDIDEDNPQRFPAKIEVTALNEPGSLAQVAAVIGEADGNIDNIKIMKQVPDYAEMVIDLEVWDLTHLNEILAGLRAKDVVSSAARVSG
ncbi:MAG TPA: bifunctional (p)ppGpp synthetase/guanosine-3',5'-bis(diphosphate) 3'-pyrophosphohydrolase [Methyloceanibacter sp.]|jgi:RelA/SpoT family (p)ppGpp synthetase|nr:bifunctional (p)ppGpp synthetase/guanosine-3',5'-bis(diphosphate) 3'-pyrophosphohydrolase [Methyloceanibacter sp.]